MSDCEDTPSQGQGGSACREKIADGCPNIQGIRFSLNRNSINLWREFVTAVK